MTNTVCIKTFSDRTEAEFAASLLESNGIKALVDVEDCGGMLALSSTGARVSVLESEADEARQILESDDTRTDASPDNAEA